MTDSEEALGRALAAIDALHAEDPERVHDGEREVARELLYAERMSAALATLEPKPSAALQLAVRAQHLQRWTRPRADFPEGRAGYHRWRLEAGKAHAALAEDAAASAGCGEETAARVSRLVRKLDRTQDPEAQTLEDAACLVFLEHELDAFAEGRSDEALVPILVKSWQKMSGRARELAGELPLSEESQRLVGLALAAQ